MQSLVRGSLLTGFSSLVESLGGDAESLLRRFGLPGDIDHHPEQFVAFRASVRLFEHCAKELSCPDFGIRLAHQQGAPVFGPVAVLVRNARTVADAFIAIGRYMHVITPAVRLRFERFSKRDYIRLHVSITEDRLGPAGQLLELLMANGTLVARMLTGEPVHASCMHFPHARLAAPDRYRTAYGCETRFDQTGCASDIPMTLMSRVVVGADLETARVAAQYLDSLQQDADASIQAQVISLVRRLLPLGQCSIKTVADSMALEKRTLQRRLAREKQIFAEIVESERRQLALDYLARPQMPLSQIAALLGYSEQSTFNRSCRRWFGEAPRSVRYNDTRSPVGRSKPE